MTDDKDKKYDFSELKVDEILADFFVKKLDKEKNDLKLRSNSNSHSETDSKDKRKKEKHKRKKKHKKSKRTYRQFSISSDDSKRISNKALQSNDRHRSSSGDSKKSKAKESKRNYRSRRRSSSDSRKSKDKEFKKKPGHRSSSSVDSRKGEDKKTKRSNRSRHRSISLNSKKSKDKESKKEPRHKSGSSVDSRKGKDKETKRNYRSRHRSSSDDCKKSKNKELKKKHRHRSSSSVDSRKGKDKETKRNSRSRHSSSDDYKKSKNKELKKKHRHRSSSSVDSRKGKETKRNSKSRHRSSSYDSKKSKDRESKKKPRRRSNSSVDSRKGKDKETKRKHRHRSNSLDSKKNKESRKKHKHKSASLDSKNDDKPREKHRHRSTSHDDSKRSNDRKSISRHRNSRSPNNNGSKSKDENLKRKRTSSSSEDSRAKEKTKPKIELREESNNQEESVKHNKENKEKSKHVASNSSKLEESRTKEIVCDNTLEEIVKNNVAKEIVCDSTPLKQIVCYSTLKQIVCDSTLKQNVCVSTLKPNVGDSTLKPSVCDSILKENLCDNTLKEIGYDNNTRTKSESNNNIDTPVLLSSNSKKENLVIPVKPNDMGERCNLLKKLDGPTKPAADIKKENEKKNEFAEAKNVTSETSNLENVGDGKLSFPSDHITVLKKQYVNNEPKIVNCSKAIGICNKNNSPTSIITSMPLATHTLKIVCDTDVTASIALLSGNCNENSNKNDSHMVKNLLEHNTKNTILPDGLGNLKILEKPSLGQTLIDSSVIENSKTNDLLKLKKETIAKGSKPHESATGQGTKKSDASKSDMSKIKTLVLEKFLKVEEKPKSSSSHHKRRKHSSSYERESKKKKSSGDRKDTKGRHSRSDREDGGKRKRSKDRSRERSKERKHKSSHHKSSRDRSSSPHKSSTRSAPGKIDKAKLLEAARKNVLTMLEKGTLPQGINLDLLKKDQLVSIKAGGKSVEELTDFCRALSKKENTDEKNSERDSNQEESDQPFIHHPFKLREQSVININIKNAVQIPVKSHAEKVAENARTMILQFPVSSGNQHRQLEWVPVEKTPTGENKTPAAQTKTITETEKSKTLITIPPVSTKSIPNPPVPPLLPPPPPPPCFNLPLTTLDTPSNPTKTVALLQPLYNSPQSNSVIPATSLPKPTVQGPSFTMSSSYSTAQTTEIFSLTSSKDFVISSIVADRFKALIKLQEDPDDAEALNEIQQAQLKLQSWVQSKQLPGQFTGCTDVKLLSVQELSGPRPAWVKRDIFSRAAPVTEGKGMSLLKKMGWNPGEGLGKNKEGSLEPLLLDIKTDKRGLVAEDECGKRIGPIPAVRDMSKKHPVSILMELCSKRKWEPPLYGIVDESGPSHRKMFLFKVRVNNTEYQPSVSRQNKKLAKAESAILCLQSLGVLPKDYASTV